MSFLDTVVRAKAYLEDQGRVSLRGLQREFGLDDDALEDLCEELVDVQCVAVRAGRVLEWAGSVPASGSAAPALDSTARPTRPGSARGVSPTASCGRIRSTTTGPTSKTVESVTP